MLAALDCPLGTADIALRDLWSTLKMYKSPVCLLSTNITLERREGERGKGGGRRKERGGRREEGGGRREEGGGGNGNGNKMLIGIILVIIALTFPKIFFTLKSPRR